MGVNMVGGLSVLPDDSAIIRAMAAHISTVIWRAPGATENQRSGQTLCVDTRNEECKS
jgi:hypothetical protein